MQLIHTLVTTLLLAPLAELYAAEGDSSAFDIALQPAHVIVSPWRQHVPPTKRQGVAGIERTAKGKLWVFWGQSADMQDGRFGMWAIVTDDPDATEPKWSAAHRRWNQAQQTHRAGERRMVTQLIGLEGGQQHQSLCQLGQGRNIHTPWHREHR